jgi:hypothetical protein
MSLLQPEWDELGIPETDDIEPADADHRPERPGEDE